MRIFAVLSNQTAVELQYSKDYPFATKPVERPSKDSQLLDPRKPLFYIHEPELVRPDIPARRIYDATWDVLSFSFNRVKVRVTLPEAAYMLFFDNYDRYWRAYVNGEKINVSRANFAFKTVFLPAGTSEVEWVYNPWKLKIAWVAYYLCLIASVVFVGLWFRRLGRGKRTA